MTQDAFYSDRAGFAVPRISEEVSAKAWKGLVALIRRRIDDGSLARAFPVRDCPDGSAITGTDQRLLLDSMDAYIPGLPANPLRASTTVDTMTALDVVDFVTPHIDQPTHTSSHSWNGDHTHYFFDDHVVYRGPGSVPTPAQRQFADDVDLLFVRNGIAFTVGDDLLLTRLVPVEARSLISELKPDTGDAALDAKLIDALSRFLSRRPADRHDALEKLWDAFERLKSLELPGQQRKRASVTKLLNDAEPSSTQFRGVLEAEFKALTDVGNGFAIRHHEHHVEDLPNSNAVDDLFVRLASMIAFVLRRTGRMSV